MKKQKALVTGASEGIGREFAVRLAKDGYEVTAIARNAARLAELQKEVGETNLIPLVADLAEEKATNNVAEVLQKGGFQLLVNNAGFGDYRPFPEAEVQAWRDMLRVNIEALVVLSHAFLATAKSGDALINVSSTLAFLPFPKGAIYAATKSFVTSFSESIWYEQKKRGVYVMSLCPGATRTLFHERAGGKNNEIPAKMTQTVGEVVDCALQALKSRTQPTVISGRKNRLMAKVPRLLSRKLTVELIGRATR